MTHVLRFELFPFVDRTNPNRRTGTGTEVAVAYTHQQVFPSAFVELVARKTLTFVLSRWLNSNDDNMDYEINMSDLVTYLERLGDAEHSRWVEQFMEATASRTNGDNGSTIWIIYK